MTRYEQWIAEYAADHPPIQYANQTSEENAFNPAIGRHSGLKGMCGHAASCMILSFCELRRVPGHVVDAEGCHEHWWCETPDGMIVDPTVDQFLHYGRPRLLCYTKWPEDEEIPIGKCMNCGELTYPSSPEACCCSDRCRKELEADFRAACGV